MYLCRLCFSKELTPFLDLGFMPPADEFKRKEQLTEPETYYPLEVVRCDACRLVQLNHVVSPEVLYRRDYPYEASMTEAGRTHFRRFAENVVKLYRLKAGDLAVDIGSNVGVLLAGFKEKGLKVLGIDPAVNIVRIAERNGIPTWPEFFNIDIARLAAERYGEASVITATNVFAHVNDLYAFMNAADALLKDKGVLVIEAPHLGSLIEHLEYDTIYHEHLSYLSLTPLVPFFKKLGFEAIRIERVDHHGGSFRVFVARAGKHRADPSVAELLKEEKAKKIHELATLNKFAGQVAENRRKLIWLLQKIKQEGKKIAAVSAPAKGMTLLNYCKIGRETLEFATEKSTLKIGRYTPGAHIPVVPDAELTKQKIDYALLLAWNFKDEIIKNLSEFSKKGGRFIVPIPEPHIVTSRGSGQPLTKKESIRV